MTIGVLAVQGAFAEHIKRLKELGIDSVELRKKDDLDKPFDGIILPGGESTVQGKLLKELDMFDTLKNMIKNEIPVLATCAGLILLAEKLENDSHTYFGTLPVTVKRLRKTAWQLLYRGRFQRYRKDSNDFYPCPLHRKQQ